MSLLPIEVRTQTDTLTTWTLRGTSNKLIVCFSGIGKDPLISPPVEFPQTASEGGTHNTIFISDPHRTWLNGGGLLEAISNEIDAFRDECGATRTLATGHSMGGFSALVIPAFTKIDAVLAFAPQISVHPEIVPNETRWAQ